MDGWVLDVYLVWSSMKVIWRKKTKGIGLLMVYDAFKAHTTDEMKAVLSINNTNLNMVLSVCNLKCQHWMFVEVNHPHVQGWNLNDLASSVKLKIKTFLERALLED